MTNKFTLTIDLENSSFHDEEGNFCPHAEVARILKELSDMNAPATERIRDINGNAVGGCEYSLSTSDSTDLITTRSCHVTNKSVAL